jgi:hypothetical protein
MNWAAGFSEAAYANLRGISCLKMGGCAISVGAISFLKGVQEIAMWGCNVGVGIALFFTFANPFLSGLGA